jgi:hypothetical protein
MAVLYMLNLERILSQDRLMRAMTGLNLKAFEELLPSFAEAYEQSLLKQEKERLRSRGGGRKRREANPLGRPCEQWQRN